MRVIEYIKTPRHILFGIFRRYGCFIKNDRRYLEWFWYLKFGKKLDLDNPRTYNEKLQWLKLYDRREEYTRMVDKIDAKEFVSSVIGEKYVIPTLGKWNSVEEIDWESLPQQFVIKATCDSGGVVVCKNKSELDISAAKRKLSSSWGKSYFKYNREYPYRNVIPRIIADEYIEDESGYELKDYKFFCFDGEPKCLFVASDRMNKGEETKFDFYDLDWNHIPVVNGHPNNPKGIMKPKNFEEMLEIARKLSAGIPHVRVDLYNCNGRIYFGEMTFFHWSGTVAFEPDDLDYKMGEWLHLPKIKETI